MVKALARLHSAQEAAAVIGNLLENSEDSSESEDELFLEVNSTASDMSGTDSDENREENTAQ